MVKKYYSLRLILGVPVYHFLMFHFRSSPSTQSRPMRTKATKRKGKGKTFSPCKCENPPPPPNPYLHCIFSASIDISLIVIIQHMLLCFILSSVVTSKHKITILGGFLHQSSDLLLCQISVCLCSIDS